MEIMELVDIRNVFHQKRSNLAFIIGNGVNRYQSTNTSASWKDLLLHLHYKVTGKRLTTIEDGILYTEFYNLLLMDEKTVEMVRQEVIEFTKQHYHPSAYHQQLQKILMEWQVPVLTTNFDGCLEQGCTMYRMKKQGVGSERFTDYYPWETYFGKDELVHPLAGFGVWHINGMTRYKRSIKMSLTEYINQTARARKFIHSNDKLMDFDNKNKPYWNGSNTWLHILFNSNLCILGLGLDINETFLRWLMIERERYFRKFPARRKKGWYLYTKLDKMEDGKRMFLHSTGFEEVLLNDYREMYEGIFVEEIWD